MAKSVNLPVNQLNEFAFSYCYNKYYGHEKVKCIIYM